MRHMLLAAIVLALTFASWRLAAIYCGNRVAIHLTTCQIGASFGVAASMFMRQQGNLVLRLTIAGALGGSIGLLLSMLAIAGGWRMFVSEQSIGIDNYVLAQFVLVWSSAGGIIGGVFGWVIGLVAMLFSKDGLG